MTLNDQYMVTGSNVDFERADDPIEDDSEPDYGSEASADSNDDAGSFYQPTLI